MGTISDQPTTVRKSPSSAQAFYTHYYAGVIRVLSCTKIILRSLQVVNSYVVACRSKAEMSVPSRRGSAGARQAIRRAAGRTARFQFTAQRSRASAR